MPSHGFELFSDRQIVDGQVQFQASTWLWECLPKSIGERVMSWTMKELRANWHEAIELYDRTIEYFTDDPSRKLRPAGASEEEARKVTDEWIAQMRRWRSELEKLLQQFPEDMKDA